MFLSSRPFVVNTTILIGLVGVEVTSVSWLVTSTPTRPVENVIATKDLQDRNIHILDGTTVENKGKNNKLILIVHIS